MSDNESGDDKVPKDSEEEDIELGIIPVGNAYMLIRF